jgi:predicted TIM-barrel fold metal-dependent hydrolase
MTDYLEAGEGKGIHQSVYVDADVDEPDMKSEVQWVLEQARDPRNPLSALVIKALPELEDFPKLLDRYGGEPLIKGIRRVLHTQPDDLSRSEMFRQNLRLLSGRNWTFDLCFLGRQLPIAIELVDACPKVQFVLDHCGVPDIKGGALDPWREHIRLLAERPNVIACKVSGLVAYAGPDWKTQDLKPYVNHVVECFGPDRLMFGSDWPVCTLGGSLAKWIDTAHELTSSWSDSEREKFFAGNACNVYRLGDHP